MEKKSKRNKWFLWIKKFGLARVSVYAFWRLLCQPALGLSNETRNKGLRFLARMFALFGLKSWATLVNENIIYIDPRNYWTLRSFVFNPYYDIDEISEVKNAVPSNYEFVDIGANFGAWTFSLASHFKKVLAIEPDLRCYSCLEKSMIRKNIPNVLIKNVALSDSEKQGEVFQTDGNFGDSRIYDPGDNRRTKGNKVNLKRFDSFIDDGSIDGKYLFIKLDVQGVEPLVLKGMQQGVQRAKDVILYTEVQDSVLRTAGFSSEEYMTLLKDLGFKPVNLFENLRPLSWEALASNKSETRDLCFRFSSTN